MVEIINISYHPKVNFPREVTLNEEMNAFRFIEELSAEYDVDTNILFKKMCLILDGERVTEKSIVKDGSRLYILAPAVGG